MDAVSSGSYRLSPAALFPPLYCVLARPVPWEFTVQQFPPSPQLPSNKTRLCPSSCAQARDRLTGHLFLFPPSKPHIFDAC
ncbi:hypothetical protein TgHK011_002781 [Trichoderma gracile]|nr:hypothetical protein TgHK011_002781 [Trichoderma gracile]